MYVYEITLLVGQNLHLLSVDRSKAHTLTNQKKSVCV